ncbi:MAG: hypothetical protein HYV09_38495 [Deltaproteobacteria bacterium]|nr:hypothetical protein [Deltaproteobacteria bacterium]
MPNVRAPTLIFLLTWASSGCAGKSADAGADAGASSADGGRDEAARGCAPIAGDGPFAVRLSGSGPVGDAGADGGTVGATINVYFPKGRVVGGEVVATGSKYGGGGTVVTGARLDETLSIRGLTVRDPDCGSGVSGDLVGPAGGFVGMAFVNSSAPSDALSMITGAVTLCASGTPAAQRVTPPPSLISPFGALTVRGTRPFASASFEKVTAKTPSGAAGITVTDADPGARISGRFSLFEPTTIDLAPLQDVLGAPLGLGSVSTVVPTTTITDLGFTSEPPEGSCLGPVEVADGKLRVGEGSSSWALALAIGDGGGKTTLRVRHRLVCDGAGTGTASVLSRNGKSVALAPKCGDAAVDQTVTLAGAGPHLLLASRSAADSRPCSYRSWPPQALVYEIDEIAFE